jgi:HAE1 family hydrophobic/amphiphilic exporter-1
VRLRDVATVRMGNKEREEITRVNGKECVEIAIFKEGDANTVTAAHNVKARLDEWKKKLPPGYELTVLFDQSHFIEQSIKEVRDSAIIGGLLAIGVLLAFLRDFRSTFIIATSIPLSVVATFLLMYRFNISLNVMSLGGLTLGIGMLVVTRSSCWNQSIANVNRACRWHARRWMAPTRVAAAVTASTLTSVAVFLPIVFVEERGPALLRPGGDCKREPHGVARGGAHADPDALRAGCAR